MRSLCLLLAGSLSGGCFLLLERLDGDPCEPSVQAFCAQNTLVLCEGRDLFRVDCGEESCDAAHRICSQCGDGIVSNNESCDDGNTIDGDGCDSTCAASGCNSGAFTPGELCLSGTPLTLSLLISPRDAALGDLDQDGDLDLAVITSEGDLGVVALFQNDSGVLSPSGSIEMGLGSTAIQIAKVDNDARPDLLVASPLDGKVYLSIQRAAGFEPAIGISTGESGPHAFSVGDLDGDATLDLAIAHQGCRDTATLSCRLGLLFSLPSLPPQVITAGFLRTQQSVSAVDLDGDQDLDLLATFPTTRELGVSNNSGFRSFLPFELAGSFSLSPDATPIAAATTLLSGGSLPTLFVLTLDNNQGAITQLENQGALQFTEGATTSLQAPPAALAIEDLDQDGTPELIILFGAEPHLEIRSTLDLSLRINIDLSSLGGSPSRLLAGEINGDGAPDLVVINPSTGAIALLLSNP
jgi:cysteine-rich repeat protein